VPCTDEQSAVIHSASRARGLGVQDFMARAATIIARRIEAGNLVQLIDIPLELTVEAPK